MPTSESPNPRLPQIPINFDRFDEYKTVLGNFQQNQTRRQSMLNLFVGLNGLFLTGVGVLLTASHLKSWWTVAVVAAIAVAVFPINLTWYFALNRYQLILQGYFRYLQQIEEEFPGSQLVAADGKPKVGMYRRQASEQDFAKHGAPTREKRLALYFLLLYPLLTATVALLTYLIAQGTLSPLVLS